MKSSFSQPSLSGTQMPSLPGYNSNPAIPKTKRQTLNYFQGGQHVISAFSTQRPTTAPMPMTLSSQSLASMSHTRDAAGYYDLSGRYSKKSQSLDKTSNMNYLPYSPDSQLPSFLKFDRKVLCFEAQYTEPISESQLEKTRVRTCVIYFYLEDGTVQAVEHQQENSGMPQGVLMKRHQLKKPDELGGGVYTQEDFKVGAVIVAYGKHFLINSCNASTAAYLREELAAGPEDYEPRESLEGEYNSMLRSKMQRETGADLTIKRNRRMHPQKMFMEASLGKPQSAVDLGQFLEHDRRVLQFTCFWDNTDALYGDQLTYKLNYYLQDDTVEILQVHKANSGRDPVPKLLKRGPLEKNPVHPTQGNCESLTSNDSKKTIYQWQDFYIGQEIFVYQRNLIIVDADGFTRKFYASQDGVQPLGERIDIEYYAQKAIEHRIPKHDGFGSEEDSLRSVYSIRPQPPRSDMSAHETEEKLTFQLELADDEEANKRIFVLNFFTKSKNVAVREPPIRNSGHLGGKWCEKHNPKWQGDALKHLKLGNTITIANHSFIVKSMDAHTENYMRRYGYTDNC